MGELDKRRRETVSRLAKLRSHLGNAEALAKGKACVFVTGSFGRCESSRFSDLDVFILSKNDEKPSRDGKQGSVLKRLDELCVKADLIKAIRKMNLPEFSDEGRYLINYSVHEFTNTLGTPEDDVTNTFTARLLLLLESRPLLESTVYGEVTKEVVDAYWRDYRDHKKEFVPGFLANNILRLWRTFCVNYEARTERVPAVKKAKGKLKNYKLKHSRLLTCYSAILYLLAIYREQDTVTAEDALAMISLTPTERVEWLLRRKALASSHSALEKILQRYEVFLKSTNASEPELVERFMDKNASRAFMGAAYGFGDLVFEVLTDIGSGNRFHRLLVV